ncbi:MAG: XRE family transcriptional regulator [Corynebacterium sp.]|jgi:DNA-binding helix-turn-helix protein|uniref:DNA-binding helix-turn-helix protein n=3 Tax=Corynebacterium matruchotii TaxID=43768 RepID=E0DBT6_9CORY|nr:helix-turn-helix transcriptional regulator [Corynebacterium matruchotii]RKW20109.1 MAG: XRE family transcriptional regulator [Corynebacterium sp.]EFM50215.1 DNA-binding helix-turn-helix protein [Corynebacterium matruchotii ATCC 14266]KAB1923848.1 helix-turn-helix transcriptional regulator [Corynebacterium matruchotii]QIP45436.1 helix-turn-helix transcriptional regulator [Corynebacterium matruchotii]SPW24317.1 putative transcriptional regulator [Corynebacterium matruchotii]
MLNIMGSRSRNDVGAFGKIVAEILNDARLNHNVSQLQLQESTGISQSQLSKQLRGIRAINLDELEAICATLSISVKEVLILAEAKLDATRKA